MHYLKIELILLCRKPKVNKDALTTKDLRYIVSITYCMLKREGYN